MRNGTTGDCYIICEGHGCAARYVASRYTFGAAIRYAMYNAEFGGGETFSVRSMKSWRELFVAFGKR